MTDGILSRAVCPRCRGRLDRALVCDTCAQAYPRLGSIAVLLPDPSAHVHHWRRQLGRIVEQGRETQHGLQMQAQEKGVGPAAQARLRALSLAVGAQVDEIAAVLGPVLGGPLPPGDEGGLPRGVVEYAAYLYRDWGGCEGHDEENGRSLSAIHRVAGGGDLGRALVLGAGACRLAYDLHRTCGATETAVVDIDPYLLVIAEAVIRGASVSLTESNANVGESDRVSRRWTLSAPSGPLGEGVFHFFLANGTEPPFEPESFDTIVTPWFIDQVPTDLADFLATAYRLLGPEGRWINHGPLIYRPDGPPLSRWYARDEVFALAEGVGFRMGPWESESRPNLCSPLTGRGRIERVLTWVGRKGRRAALHPSV